MDSTGSFENAGLPKLTRREQQTLELFLKGMAMKEVAACLGVSASTVNTYSNSIYRKLGVNSRAQLLLRCYDLIEREHLEDEV